MEHILNLWNIRPEAQPIGGDHDTLLAVSEVLEVDVLSKALLQLRSAVIRPRPWEEKERGGTVMANPSARQPVRRILMLFSSSEYEGHIGAKEPDQPSSC